MAEAWLTNVVPPANEATAALVLADGTTFRGHGLGAVGTAVGEVCFNTAMSGYQEILTDPSYAGQIITFTFPHIGNVGANDEDVETSTPAARGLVVRAPITEPSNFRAAWHLDDWLKRYGLVGMCGIDTRRLTRLIRDGGPQTGALRHAAAPGDGALDLAALAAEAKAWPGLEGMDLAKEVSCAETHAWTETRWSLSRGHGIQDCPSFHVVVVDYGAKHNILRCLAASGCRLTVVPANSAAAEIMAQAPDGVFLSNGPGDPVATGAYAVPVIRELIGAGVPLFGICLGFQMLALAMGATTSKMYRGHRGANHPVKDLKTGKVEITSHNHGFVVDADSLPAGVTATHRSLFDGSLEGLTVEGRPIFGVQYHPEASPGPHDSQYLFERFVGQMVTHA